jgi:hypothetical protein
MKDNYDFSNGRKNPYAKKLKEEGYTVMIHHSPKDIEKPDALLSEFTYEDETTRDKQDKMIK